MKLWWKHNSQCTLSYITEFIVVISHDIMIIELLVTFYVYTLYRLLLCCDYTGKLAILK